MSEVPHGWALVTLGEVTAPRGEKADPSDLDDLPFIGLEEVEAHTGRVIRMQTTTGLKSAVALFGKDDLLYGRLRPYLNKVVLAEGSGAASAEFIVLPPSEALDQSFLQRTLMSPDFVQFAGLRSTGDRPRVSFEGVSDYQFPLPPLAEQRRIVAKIDGLTGKSRRARDHLDHIPRLVEKYKQAVLAAAFRGDLTREWRATKGVLEDRPVQVDIELPYRQSFTAPSSWRPMTFEEVCTIQGGSQPPKSNFEYSPAAHLIRFVQIRDYKSDERITYIPRALARRICSADDIMIGRYGPPIFQILRGIEGAYNVALMKAVPNERLIEREYLYRYLNYPALRSYVEFEAQRTAGQDGVNKRHLLAWPVLLPPLAEQRQIVHRVDQMMGWIDRLASEATSARRLIDHLDQSILAKAFRGELVPQDPADQTARVLLERIRAERGTAPKVRRGRRAKANA
ncbi:restriction endonuclease subunit S [Mesorhizobium sp. M1378]|uniref:restriction endonuclease subunit S n=1 Tax=Mesorhizobium sp. M1378 TaxID=2957092 RepID=UPI00333998F9